jgi:putative two-component system response regulator
LLLGQELALSPEDVRSLRIGTPLHDLGKIAAPDGILFKPGTLTDEEFASMKTLTTPAAKILERVSRARPSRARSASAPWPTPSTP